MGLFVSNKNVTYVCLFHWSSFQHLSDSKLCLKKSVLFWHQSQLPYLNTRLLELLVYHIQSQGLVLITLVYFKILFVGFVKYNIKILLLLLFFFLFWYQCCSPGSCYDCCNGCYRRRAVFYFEKMICIHCLNRFQIVYRYFKIKNIMPSIIHYAWHAQHLKVYSVLWFSVVQRTRINDQSNQL